MSKPTAAARPASESELMQALSEPGGAFELVAGGTKRGIGRPVEAAALDLSALRGIVDYEPRELVLTARPGTPLQEIQTLLASEGQRLGFEPPAEIGQTLGGVLMANRSGSRRLTAGSARDHFIGLRAVNGLGEAFVGGGRVVKNVTGFDLPKVLAGSWGTLAALTEVTVRVVPMAESEATLLFAANGPQAAVELCSLALGSCFDVSAAAFDPARGVALRLEGLASSVQSRIEGLLGSLAHPAQDRLDTETSRSFWHHIGAVTALAHHPVLWRLSVAPTQAPAILASLDTQAFQLDWGGGLIWLGAAAVEAGRIRAALKGGHATLMRAPLEERRRTRVFEPPGPALAALSARLKAAFDPHGRLNPGRMD